MTDREKQTVEQGTPYIQRVIGGRTYTVKIHFNPNGKETAQDKMKRILQNEAEQKRRMT
ncbi:MAG: transposon-encoded TnpW family protein [Lachnospiraceae bacterium]|nr:transposon-encoded TnpW family protein [Lachnospiraceae bacterium]